MPPTSLRDVGPGVLAGSELGALLCLDRGCGELFVFLAGGAGQEHP
jgi:hypothetical protein